jgi:hypothetical protein
VCHFNFLWASCGHLSYEPTRCDRFPGCIRWQRLELGQLANVEGCCLDCSCRGLFHAVQLSPTVIYQRRAVALEIQLQKQQRAERVHKCDMPLSRVFATWLTTVNLTWCAASAKYKLASD